MDVMTGRNQEVQITPIEKIANGSFRWISNIPKRNPDGSFRTEADASFVAELREQLGDEAVDITLGMNMTDLDKDGIPTGCEAMESVIVDSAAWFSLHPDAI